MAWKQSREPNLDPYIVQGGVTLNDWLGWCLAYVQSAFASGWAGATAWKGWTDIAQKKHTDKNFPVGVWFPMWFSGYYGLGHVALAKVASDGSMTISSSPVSHKPYADTWSSVAEIERNYGVSYAGWSEDIGGTTIIEQVPDPVPQPTPVPLSDKQRKISNADGINGRREPNTSSEIVQEFAQGDVLDMKGYIKGEAVSGNDVWFLGAYAGNAFWSGAFEGGANTNGLADMTPVVVTPPTPVEVPPTQGSVGYTFEKELDCVSEVIPAAVGNFEVGRFPDKPAKVVMHDFGTKDVDTLGSVINHFTGKGVEVSAHFVVSGKRIIQMVSLKDRAYHAGPNGNDFIGIELDPNQDKDTIASGKVVLQQLKDKYGYKFALIEHNQIMQTLCGDDIDLADYEIDEPITEPIEQKPDYDKENNSLLKQILDILKKIFKF